MKKVLELLGSGNIVEVDKGKLDKTEKAYRKVVAKATGKLQELGKQYLSLQEALLNLEEQIAETKQLIAAQREEILEAKQYIQSFGNLRAAIEAEDETED
ncbi:MAG: hypothetical protein AAGI23_09480 [Bacteroidota bacterium]